MIRSFVDRSPHIHPTVFVASDAQVIGDVYLGEGVSIWFGAILRGDINYIRIGERGNIQDGCLLHVTEGDPLVVGDEVTVGHGAILHGCRIDGEFIAKLRISEYKVQKSKLLSLVGLIGNSKSFHFSIFNLQFSMAGFRKLDINF